jgi:hypothetical protein
MECSVRPQGHGFAFQGKARRTRNDERGRAVRDPVLGRGVGAALIFPGPVLPALLVGVILI